jgi:hypothetical protein
LLYRATLTALNYIIWTRTALEVALIGGLSCGVQIRLLRYLKKTENRYRKKNTDNTDISIFFRDRILLNCMQKFLFANDAKQPRYNSFDSSGA